MVIKNQWLNYFKSILLIVKNDKKNFQATNDDDVNNVASANVGQVAPNAELLVPSSENNDDENENIANKYDFLLYSGFGKYFKVNIFCDFLNQC